MKPVARIVALAGALAVASPALADPLTDAERAALQSAMVQHIDRQTIDGLYLKVDVAAGEIRKYAPAKAHPMILSMGQHYVLCTDFKDAQGNATNVDFYVARRGKGFAIFHTEIDNRAPLMKLIEGGKAKPL